MCTVEKMLIKGIRSFSPDNTNVIEFPKPLTLIVGRNGSGKTTIIECLKHACTGEFPPHAKAGHTFVHDPKVAHETEVKAQIKLRCRTVTGKPFVVIRSFQMTQKAQRQEFKALDQVIQTIDENDQPQALSKKCADINVEVPALMGVSKAILDNVIFVHQDDSNWPLSEGAVLKTKFDDIFAATKYTRALDTIRKLKTEQAGQAKEFKLKLENLGTYKNSAVKLRRDIAEDEARSDKVRELMKTLSEDIDGAQARLDELERQTSALAEKQNELSVVCAKRDTLIVENTKRYEALDQEFQEPLDQLIEAQAKFEEKMTSVRHTKNALERELHEKRLQTESLKEHYSKECTQKGRLQAEYDAQVNRLQERRGAVRALAQSFPQVGMTLVTEPTEEQVAEFRDKLEERLQNLRAQCEEVRTTNRRIEEQHTRSIDKISEKLSGTAEAVRMKKEQRAKNDRRVDQLLHEAERCAVSDDSLEVAARHVADCTRAFDERVAQVNEADYNSQLLLKRRQVQDLQAAEQALEAERHKLALVGEALVQLRLKRQERGNKENALEQRLEARRGRILSALGASEIPPLEELPQHLERAISSKAAASRAKSSELGAKQNALAAVDARLTAARQQVERLRAEADAGRAALSAAPGVLDGDALESFPARMQAAEAALTSARGNFTTLTAMRNLLGEWIRKAESEHCCATCNRGFDVVAEQDFVREKRTVMENFPDRVADAERAIADAEQLVESFKGLQATYQRVQAVGATEAPAAEAQARALEAEHGELSAAVERLDTEAAMLKAEYDVAVQLGPEIEAVDRTRREIAALADDVTQLERKTAAAQTAEGRTTADVNEEVAKAADERRQAERERDELAAREQRAQQEVAQLDRAVRDARDEEAKQRSLKERRDALQREREQLVADNARLDEEVQGAEAGRAPLQREKDDALATREQERGAALERQREADEQLASLQRATDSLAMQSRDIEAYEDSGKFEQLARVNSSIEATKARQQANETEMAKLQESLTTSEKTYKQQDALKRNIDDNVAYRRGKDQELELGTHVERLQAELEAVGQPETLEAERKTLQNSTSNLRQKLAMHHGTLNAYAQNMEKNRNDLRANEYKDIDRRYRSMLIDLKTLEMANGDLDKYYTALDRALMAFHEAKMKEINKTIKELWQKTYRGSDIDYIEIKSEGASAASQARGRSYNYRVVMQSGGAELDMRGRCSAGQRVLACLLIRLALAETFCLNCGILALDEPTTNLDEANSRSLAQSLLEVMEARKEQSNFQLIVITHDLDFAQAVGHREHADYYWRISKQNGHSTIEREEIFE